MKMDDSLPSISIVTPCFNSQDYIEECIDSVLSQNYPNIQYIVVDGNSVDRTMDIVRKYERYIDLIISEDDDGQSHALDKGFSFSTGMIFNWINSDDALRKGSLETVGRFFQEHDCNVLIGKSLVYGLSNDKLSRGTDLYSSVEKTVARARIDQPETFFRTNCLRTIRGLDRSLHYLMDRELWMRYLLYYGLDDVYKINTVLAEFRLHDSSKTVSQQDGFRLEQNRIEHALLRSYSQPLHSYNDLPLLSTSLLDTKFSINMIRFEYLLHRYEISYAERDWLQMFLFLFACLRYWSCLKPSSAQVLFSLLIRSIVQIPLSLVR